MIYLYRFLFIPVFLLVTPYYVWRMLKRGGYRRGFQYRFGLGSFLPNKKPGVRRIWLHAVSVGEMRAIGPLLKQLAALRNPQVEVVLSTTTSTAYTLAKQKYRSMVMQIRVFPLDFWLFSWRTWNRISPDLAILMEGDLWPEHIHQANARKIPIVVINARLSERSYSRYRRIRLLARPFLRKINSLSASSRQDFERFMALGRQPFNTYYGGNLKFDVTLDPLLSKEGKALLLTYMSFDQGAQASPPLILLGASTWPGEELFLMDVYKEARALGFDCRLILVPRHAERRKELERLLRDQKVPYHFRANNTQAPKDNQVYVVDTTGELQSFIQVADIVFIGKSLSPNRGGQTPIEAAAAGKPIVYGSHMGNFGPMCKSLEAYGASLRAEGREEAKACIIDLIENPEGRIAMATAAKKWHQDNQGATLWTIERLKPFLEE